MHRLSIPFAALLLLFTATVTAQGSTKLPILPADQSLDFPIDNRPLQVTDLPDVQDDVFTGFLFPSGPTDTGLDSSFLKDMNAHQLFNVPESVSAGRQMARLWIRWSNGNSGHCSCTMIGPNLAITAGHCVAKPNSDVRLTGASTVTPAQRGASTPYGSVSITRYWTFPAWTDNANYAYDIAVVELSKPLGVYTGFARVDLDFDRDDLRDYDQFVSGYPGGSFADGVTPFYRQGTMDWVNDDFGRINSTSYGGESGSSARFPLAGGDMAINSILSFGRVEGGQWKTYFSRLDGFRREEIELIWRSQFRTNRWDLLTVSGNMEGADFRQSGTIVPDVLYTVQVFNHGLHRFQSTLGANLVLRRERDLSIPSPEYTVAFVSAQRTISSNRWGGMGGETNLDLRGVPPGCYYLVAKVARQRLPWEAGWNPVGPSSQLGISSYRFCVDPPPYCEGVTVMRGDTGVIEDGSPGDVAYAQNSDCGWIIRAPETGGPYEIKVEFDRFNVAEDDTRLRVSEAGDGNEQYLTTFDRWRNPVGVTLRSREKEVRLEFETGPRDRQGRGFTARYEIRSLAPSFGPEELAPRVFPNPIEGILFIDIPNPGLEETISYRLVEMGTGRFIREGLWTSRVRQQLNTSGFAPGGYDLIIHRADKVFHHKIIKL